jgi:hypothetical protein
MKDLVAGWREYAADAGIKDAARTLLILHDHRKDSGLGGPDTMGG